MDASHRHWGAVLYEEDKKGKRQICGYKSDTFKDSQLHHHSTFKELLAIKQEILKFEFHLIGNHFLVETDFAALKGILKFKPNKAINTQLLKLAAWFLQYSFDISHIKGKVNIIPDFLSRPAINFITKHIHNPIPLFFMITHMASSSSSFYHNLLDTFPIDALSIITSPDPVNRTAKRALKMQTQLIKKMGNQIFHDLGIHPKYPFAKLLPFRDALYMSKQLSNFFWYLTSYYTIAIEVPTVPLHTTIQLFQDRPDYRPACETQINTLTCLNTNNACPLKCNTIFLISLNCELIGNTPNFHPKLEVFTSGETPLREDSPVYRRLQKQLFLQNKIIPDKIWPSHPKMLHGKSFQKNTCYDSQGNLTTIIPILPQLLVILVHLLVPTPTIPPNLHQFSQLTITDDEEEDPPRFCTQPRPSCTRPTEDSTNE
ncbi:hypothetical protein TIFTF001_035711 [Ficus carica]|uniref:Reverse transcriptase RNase H-like domain-containing protein n=1 Tax=Ficus carica TaxID=3494 RepID=A0AA88EBA9_FICCA|nr:hypothetical protein TIFTF001_035710 [Ficus carica]GMN66649.1 hypothetical protein TIFTF001_035711 [Ficus carica]